MAQVLIRDLDPIVIDRLRTRARYNHRSLEAELRLIIESAVDNPTLDVCAEVDRIRALFTGRTFDDSATLLREDRDR